MLRRACTYDTGMTWPVKVPVSINSADRSPVRAAYGTDTDAQVIERLARRHRSAARLAWMGWDILLYGLRESSRYFRAAWLVLERSADRQLTELDRAIERHAAEQIEDLKRFVRQLVVRVSALTLDDVLLYFRSHKVLTSMLMTDAALGLAVASMIALTLQGLRAAGGGPPAHVTPIAPSFGLGLALAATPQPSAVPTNAPAPTSTLLPAPTATPIPIIYTSWESTLPSYNGWDGEGACSGPVLAPVGSGIFTWPTDKRYLVGYNYNFRWHPGLDLGGLVGDPLYAADSGVVVYSGWNTYGYGNTVAIDHGNGWHTLYAHLSEIHVACGQAVEQGGVIGLAGSTGRSTGPHLHFEMRRSGVNVSPWGYLP